MSWTKIQIKQHEQAAKVFNEIIYEAAEHIKNHPETTDVAIRKFIAGRFKKYHLISDKQKSIVAFGSDTANIHYYAEKPRKLKSGDLIMIDIWARLAETGAPFADITWMLYYGRKLPKQQADAFRVVVQARDEAIKYLQSNLKKKIVPLGREIDAVARNYLTRRGQGDKFLHGTGHSLGLTSPHGERTRISRKGRQPLPLNVGYTIEPGIYFKNSPSHLNCKNKYFSKKINLNIKCGGKFGVRSEIDFYIDSPREIWLRRSSSHEIRFASRRDFTGQAISRSKNFKLIITTICQKQIIKIWKKN